MDLLLHLLLLLLLLLGHCKMHGSQAFLDFLFDGVEIP